MARGAYSSVLSQARGRVGEQVYVKTRSGLAIKSRPRYRQFPNPATAGARERMIRAKDAWLGLDVEQVRAWRAFAKQIHRVNPVDGTEYSPIAYNAFIMLATRYLQANPMGEIPVWPPEEEFAGEDVVLAVNKIDDLRLTKPGEIDDSRLTIDDSGKGKAAHSGSLNRQSTINNRQSNRQSTINNRQSNSQSTNANRPSNCQSSINNRQSSEAGVVRLCASGPNSPDVVTEILVQKLPNIRRSPTKFYKSTAIHQFLPGELTFDLELPEGVYAFAYRFIQSTTGLCTGLGTFGEIVVIEGIDD